MYDVCIIVYVCIIYEFMYLCIYICMYYVWMYVCMYVCMHVCKCMFVCFFHILVNRYSLYCKEPDEELRGTQKYVDTDPNIYSDVCYISLILHVLCICTFLHRLLVRIKVSLSNCLGQV